MRSAVKTDVRTTIPVTPEMAEVGFLKLTSFDLREGWAEELREAAIETYRAMAAIAPTNRYYGANAGRPKTHDF